MGNDYAERKESSTVHEMKSEVKACVAEKLHEITSEFQKDMHETESEIGKLSDGSLHETTSEPEKNAHEMESDLTDQKTETVLDKGSWAGGDRREGVSERRKRTYVGTKSGA